MFDKIGQAVEKMALSMSRRGFLGSLGKSALAVTGVLGFAASASAGNNYTCCFCRSQWQWWWTCVPGRRCPQGEYYSCRKSHGCC